VYYKFVVKKELNIEAALGEDFCRGIMNPSLDMLAAPVHNASDAL